MRKIFPWISLNGKIVEQKDAVVSVFDEGFLYGFGFFTTVKIRESIPLFFEKHTERLEKSAEKLSFRLPENFTSIGNDVIAVITKNEITEGAIRITITKGLEKKPTILIHATTIEKEVHEVSVMTIPDERDIYKTIKMTYRVPHLLAVQKAQERGAQDALFSQNDFLIESTYANIYSYHEGEIITPPIRNKGLNGISRQILLEQLPIHQKEISIKTQNPMVLVSSLSLRIVDKIDGIKIKKNTGFFAQIKNALEDAEKNYIAAQ
jgi:branched-subunit amino acid aminotransferase/4-amino-4-deoxychorismate lyase